MVKKVLSIAGSDSSGGAGIQADIKTISAFGMYAETCITALTAQNTVTVKESLPVPADFLKKQIDAVFEDIEIDAVKLGMLPNAQIIKAVSDRLKRYKAKNIVCDPVLVATSGDTLSADSVIPAYIEHIFPISTVITPNIPEAEAFTGEDFSSYGGSTEDTMRKIARRFSDMGANAVLIKGGHLQGEKIIDLLAVFGNSPGEMTDHVFGGVKLNSPNTHGTGCTLSSAIAAGLAQGLSLDWAVREAQSYVFKAIENSYTVGKGHSPVNHFYGLWK